MGERWHGRSWEEAVDLRGVGAAGPGGGGTSQVCPPKPFAWDWHPLRVPSARLLGTDGAQEARAGSQVR